MAEKRDYYEVLGVAKNANADEIKKLPNEVCVIVFTFFHEGEYDP